jgi:hypothetical protein
VVGSGVFLPIPAARCCWRLGGAEGGGTGGAFCRSVGWECGLKNGPEPMLAGLSPLGSGVLLEVK